MANSTTTITSGQKDIHKSTEKKTIKIALGGNPNCGKTTLFNQLTGSNQYVGNWPGVTVEKKEGKARFQGREIIVSDLPGIYSLSPYTPEEIVTRHTLLHDNPDIIIDIVDATNLERNLYLTTQIQEIQRPVIIALNMIDLLEKRGDTIDCKVLEKRFGVPVVPISASKNTGIDTLMAKAIAIAEGGQQQPVQRLYSKKVERVIADIQEALFEVDGKEHLRFTAVKLFEGDSVTWENYKFNKQQQDHIEFHINEIETTQYIDREMIIADERYKFICATCERAVTKGHPQGYETMSDKADKVITNKYLALPLFLLMMFGVFFITFGPVGSYLKDGAEWLILDVLTPQVSSLLVSINASDWAFSLIIDGIIAGVGAVVSFLPQISILFLLLSILEDSGYMARAAFIMDKLLRMIGLSGRAFVPMLMGFGCTVPAVLGTRTLENEKDKRLTILITPFMSCSAKMPVYLLFISVFFNESSPLVIFSIYLLGILVAILTALIFSRTILKGKDAPFVLELPPYRMPSPKTLWLHVWERVKDFLVRAGTILMGAAVLIWFLQSFNFRLEQVSDSSQSILATIGIAIAPIFSLCGFGDWQSSVSLLTGIVAKESVVSTMTVLFGGDTSMISQVFTPLSAYSFMTFVLLYTPCVAALSAIGKEMGSRKWTAIAIVYQLAVAWVVSMLVFQIGSLFVG
ncbi:MAG TPA: ferrous iron transport protein B [Clostridiales bacterium]|nr:ferrous iron transport protein B [Clostridiales bacterium]